MEMKTVRFGNHILNNDHDGYVYSYNTSHSYDFNSHLHKCHEFIHIVKGRLIYTVEGSDYMLSEGDVIMTKPNELHSFSFPDNCDYAREFLHIYPGFTDKFPELLKPLNTRSEGYYNRIPAKVVLKYGIDKIFHDLESYCDENEDLRDFLALTSSLQLIARIDHILATEHPEVQKVITNKKANAIFDYVDLHLSEKISIDSIARSLYVSPSYLSRVFKKETGMTIKTYINMRRIIKAKNLLLQGGRITDIFLECGFCDYSTFYRSFLKYAGLSPEEFKHTNKLNIV